GDGEAGQHDAEGGGHRPADQHRLGLRALAIAAIAQRAGDQAEAGDGDDRADDDEAEVHCRPAAISDALGLYSSRPEPWTATIRPTKMRMTAVWLPVRAAPSAPRRR